MKIKKRLNLYVCEYFCHTITCDVDKGVTPFTIPCQFTGREDRPLNPKYSKNGKCTGIAFSKMYPREIPDHINIPVPTHEWYKPNVLDYFNCFDEDGNKLNLSKEEVDHVLNGGLLLRKRTTKEILDHDL